jgi:cell division protein FtsI (penicillin-binding protein 3)
VRDFKNSSESFAPTRWMRLRVALLGLVFASALAADFARAFVLQVNQKEKLKSMAQDQYVRELEIPARRGEVFDRRGVPLAQSVDVDSIYVDPGMLEDQTLGARMLARELGLDQKELIVRMQRGKRFAWVKRQASPAEVAKVKALNLNAIGFAKEPRRFYPQRELGAHVLGLVGSEGRGLDGLELAFDDELSGEGVKTGAFRDARGRKLLTQGTVDLASREGAQVTLTLDRHLQYVTEKALTRAVTDAKATAGMAIVLDPRTGEILALANAPSFNPNAPNGVPSDALRNRSITDQFEPGSTMKSFVIASALDARVIQESSTFDCMMGAWKIGKYTVNDTHPHGTLDTRGILQVSSNICAAKVGGLLGRERLVDTFNRFGFGTRQNLGLPGETKGSLPFPKAEIQLATQSFGQGMTSSAIQLAAAYGALANDGVLMRPYLVAKVVDADGVALLDNQPTEVRRVVSAKTARTVVGMLESVVEKGGTAPLARMDEYRVAGKTGTAQKAGPGGYSDKRIASFAGILPAEDPRLVVLVVVDEPKTDVYGGLVAAPAFKEIASAAMPYLGITPSRTAPPKEQAKDAVVAKTAPATPAVEPKAQVSPELAAALDSATLEEGTVRVPDLTQQPARAAVGKLLAAALEPRLLGSGAVARQTPPAGTPVLRGSRVTLELAGALPLSAR